MARRRPAAVWPDHEAIRFVGTPRRDRLSGDRLSVDRLSVDRLSVDALPSVMRTSTSEVTAVAGPRRGRELAKIALRSFLYRRDFDLVRHPYLSRLTATLAWLDVDTVLDIGANIGQYASALRASGYRGRIVSCEPVSDAYAFLERRSRHDANWLIENVAVAATPGISKIQVSANSYSSSLRAVTDAHLHAAPDSAIVRTEEVQTTTVDELAARYAVRPDHTLLKVDTQGYEAEVLAGATGLLASVAAVQLELSMVELYAGQQLFDDLVTRLREAGFTLFGIEPGICDPDSGRLLQCDGLFVSTAAIAARGAAPARDEPA
jgi:FkbM family methyltransferase